MKNWLKYIVIYIIKNGNKYRKVNIVKINYYMASKDSHINIY
jgi:hypothetical protein